MARQYYRNPYSTRRPPERSPAPSLAGIWLLIGIFMGVGIMGIAYIFYSPVIPHHLKSSSEYYGSQPAPASSAAPNVMSDNDVQATNPTNPTNQKRQSRSSQSSNQSAKTHQNDSGQRFEFYTLLPGMEVELPDAKPSAPTKAPANIAQKSSATHANAAQSPKNHVSSQTNSQTMNLQSPNAAKKTQAQVIQQGRTPTSGTSLQQAQSMPQLNPNASQTSQRTQGDAHHGGAHHGGAQKIQGRSPQVLSPQAAAMSGQRSQPAAHYIIQAGLFQKLNEADALKARLTLQGFNPRLQKVQTQQGNAWYRVTLGPFPTESGALQQKKRLEDQKIRSILILQRPNA